MSVQLPGARASFVGPDGRPTTEFYNFLEGLQRLQSAYASQTQLAAINTQLAGLQAEIDALPTSAGYPILQALFPIVSNGLLQNGFAQLSWQGTTDEVPEGDTNLYYTQARFWAALKAALVENSNITLTPDDGAQTMTIASNGGVIPMVTGGVQNGQPTFIYFDDGSLLYAEAA
jgi:hypothetical protein